MFLMFQHFGLVKVNLVWGIRKHCGILEGKKVIDCSIKTRNMETSITSETISQQTFYGEIERSDDKDWKFPEIAKKRP